MAAPTYFGSNSNPADAGTANEPTTLAVTPPGSCIAGDLVFLIGQIGVASTGQISVSATGGQTWNSAGTTAANGQCCAVWWCEFNGTWSVNPSLQFSAQSGTVPTTAVMHVFRPQDANETWEADNAYSGAGFAAAASITITGVTTTKVNTLALAGWFSADDNTWSESTGFTSNVEVTQLTNTGTVVDVMGGASGSGQTAQAQGQSFTVGGSSITLDGFEVRLGAVGSPSDGLYAEIASAIDGATLATSNTVPAAEIQGAYNRFLFPATTLSASTKYYLRILRSGSRDTGNYYRIYYSNGGSLANAGMYARDNNAWSAETAANDWDFRVFKVVAGWVTPGSAQYRNTAGADQSCTFGYYAQSSTGSTGNATKTEATLGNDAGVQFIMSLSSKPPVVAIPNKINSIRQAIHAAAYY